MATKKKASAKSSKGAAPKSMIGKRVIVRAYAAGVHQGVLVSRSAEGGQVTVVLSDCERLFYFKVAQMTGQVSSCSELAQYGIKRDASKFGARLETHEVSGVIEILPMTAAACGTFA